MNRHQTPEKHILPGVLVLAASYLLKAASEESKEKENLKTTRSCWIKDYRKSRNPIGNTQTLMKELKPNTFDYKNFLRMDEDCFNFILSLIRQDITKKDTVMRAAISPEEKFAVTLRFLATGEKFIELDYNSRLSKSFLTDAVLDVCDAIYRNLKDQFLKFPTTEREWSQIADEYNLKWQFPNCLGALDGKHIAFRPSKNIAPLYYNYKGYHSIVLLGVADAYGRFIFIDVGCNGRISDGGVLQRSDFMYILNDPEKYLPHKKLIGNSRLLPHVFVADNAFALTENIMTPYPFTNTEERKKAYNYRLSRARQNIERAFGILSNRFQIFQAPIKLHQDKVKKIVQCCCVLHNFLITRSRWYAEEVQPNSVSTATSTTSASQPLPDGSQSNEPISTTGEAIRAQFTEYFSNEGAM